MRLTPTRKKEVQKRFLSYVRKTRGCWFWVGGGEVYGHFSFVDSDGKQCQITAHRASYVLFKGRLPKNKDKGKTCICVLHTCDTPKCVKPDHLFKGTHASNVEDKVNKKRQTWGEKNPRAELTVAQVAWIRKHYVPHHPGKYSGKAIAKKFNVARSTISYIVNDQHWTIGMN